MLVRLIYIVEVLSVILCVKFAFGENTRVKIGDFVLLAIETVYLEVINEVPLASEFFVGTYIIYFIYLQIENHGDIKRNLMNLFLSVLIIGLIQLLLSMAFFWIELIGNQSYIILLLNIICSLIVFILGKNKIIYNISNKILANELMIRIVTAILFFTFVYLIFLHKWDRYFRLTDYLFFGVWTVMLCYLMIQWEKTKMDNLAKSRALEVKKVYEQNYKYLLDSVRKRQHDFDNHLSALYSQHLFADSLDELIEKQQNYSTLVLYKNRYNKLIVKGSESPILTGFLFSKFMEAEEKGCHVVYEVSYNTMECVLADYQLIDVFGVLFDNAIEALETFEGEKELRFILREYKDRIESGVYNRSPYISAYDLHQMMQNEVSTKGSNRGIGLPKVIEILNEQGIELFVLNKTFQEKNYLAFEFQLKKKTL